MSKKEKMEIWLRIGINYMNNIDKSSSIIILPLMKKTKEFVKQGRLKLIIAILLL